MESKSELLKDFYRTEIALFRELLECISMERQNLINMEVKNLWSVMEHKNKILKSIEESRQNFDNIIDSENPYAGVLTEEKETISNLKRTLMRLREQISTMVKENVSFINETLLFFNDMVSIFTSPNSSNTAYGTSQKNRKKAPNLIYQNEV